MVKAHSNNMLGMRCSHWCHSFRCLPQDTSNKQDVMYIVEEGQGDAAAMAEAMRLSPEDQAKKAAAMQQIREDSYKANDEIVTKVMQGKV